MHDCIKIYSKIKNFLTKKQKSRFLKKIVNLEEEQQSF